jgi:hypothetical protein
MAEAQARRKKRWWIIVALVLGVPLVWIWSKRGYSPHIHADSKYAVDCIELEEGSRFVRSGWSRDRDRDGQDDILVVYVSSSRRDWVQSLFQWKRVFQPNRHQVIRLSSADGSELASDVYSKDDRLKHHLAMNGRSCFHLQPSGGGIEICSDPAQCCVPEPRIPFNISGQQFEAFTEKRGFETYFVVENRSENESVLREALGRFGRLYDWPATREQGRCLLYYGAPGSWEELSEVRLREDEQDDRWPISSEILGTSGSSFFPLHATLDAQKVSQLLAVSEGVSEREFVRLGLGDDLEVVPLGSVPRGVSAHGQFGAPICVVPQDGDFFLVHARALAAAPYPVVLDVKLPGRELHEVTLPVDLDAYDFGMISMARGRHAVTPFVGPQQVLAQRIPDLNQDQIDDWRVLIRVDGCRGGLLVSAKLSGATGQLLERLMDT